MNELKDRSSLRSLILNIFDDIFMILSNAKILCTLLVKKTVINAFNKQK